MKRWISILLTLLLSACATQTTPTATPVPSTISKPVAALSPATELTTPNTSSTSQPSLADFPDLGPAPELTGEVWINTSTPLRLADLRGQVVLVDMWTFG